MPPFGYDRRDERSRPNRCRIRRRRRRQAAAYRTDGTNFYDAVRCSLCATRCTLHVIRCM